MAHSSGGGIGDTPGLTAEREARLRDDFSRGFIRNCGIRLIRLERGRAESRLEITAEHTQQDGFVHAGVMATMVDHTAGYAAFSVVEDDRRILTMEFKINYLRPASGTTLICRSRVIKEGGTIVVGDSEVFALADGEEKLVAKALVTLMSVPGEHLRSPARSSSESR